MITRLLSVLMMVLFLGVASVQTGCETAPGLNQQFGYVIEYLPKPPDVVIPATRQALQDMQWMVMSQSDSGTTTTILARNTYDDQALIKITFAPESSSEVAVKIDPDESEVLSRQIIQKIRAQIMPVTR